jgi:hypothetical protein
MTYILSEKYRSGFRLLSDFRATHCIVLYIWEPSIFIMLAMTLTWKKTHTQKDIGNILDRSRNEVQTQTLLEIALAVTIWICMSR